MIGSYSILQSTIRFISTSKYDIKIYPEITIDPNIGEKVKIDKHLKIVQEKYLSPGENNHNLYIFRYNPNCDKYDIYKSKGYVILKKSKFLSYSLQYIIAPYYEGKHSKKNNEIKVYIGKDKNLCLVLNKLEKKYVDWATGEEHKGYMLDKVYYNNEDVTNHILKFSCFLSNIFTAISILKDKFAIRKVIELKFSEFVKNKYSCIYNNAKYFIAYNILNDDDSTLIHLSTLGVSEYWEDRISKKDTSCVLFYKNRYMIISCYDGFAVIDFMSDKVWIVLYKGEKKPPIKYIEPHKHGNKTYIGDYIVYFEENGEVVIKNRKEDIPIHSYVFLNGKELLFMDTPKILIEYLFEIPVYMHLRYQKHSEFSMLSLYHSGSNLYDDILFIRKYEGDRPSEKDIPYYSPVVMSQLYDKS